MRLAIRHTTRYRFDQPVAHALQRLRLFPKTTQGQAVVEWTMDYTSARQELEYEDQHHNHVTLVALEPGATEVVITCHGVVETNDKAGIIGRHAGHLPRHRPYRPCRCEGAPPTAGRPFGVCAAQRRSPATIDQTSRSTRPLCTYPALRSRPS